MLAGNFFEDSFCFLTFFIVGFVAIGAPFGLNYYVTAAFLIFSELILNAAM